MSTGLFYVGWWQTCIIILIYTHLTIVAVTLYLHRSQAHKSIEISPVVSHFFRCWLWLTTGMNTKEWISVHRRHHAMVDSTGDPHSPVVFGLKKVLMEGTELYRAGLKDPDTLLRYGFGSPDDWVERHVYSAHRSAGVLAMFGVNFLLFGFKGITITAIQMLWIPFFAAGVVNGMGHNSGYRNFETPDNSTNLFPIGALIGGEELHNNHHAFSNSAKFSFKPWELDVGWGYIRVLALIGLAKVKNVYNANLVENQNKLALDEETARAVVSNRLIIMADYGRLVLQKVHKEECRNLSGSALKRLKHARTILLKDGKRLTKLEKSTLDFCLGSYAQLGTAYYFREKLSKLYESRSSENMAITPLLIEWCYSAEQTGIRALRDFAATLRSYSCSPV